jgi:hypothetical protein
VLKRMCSSSMRWNTLQTSVRTIWSMIQFNSLKFLFLIFCLDDLYIDKKWDIKIIHYYFVWIYLFLYLQCLCFMKLVATM